MVTTPVVPARAGDTRTNKDYEFVPAINLTIDDTTSDFFPQVDGFDHLAMRNPHFSGNNESSSKGRFLYSTAFEKAGSVISWTPMLLLGSVPSIIKKSIF